LRRKDCQRGRTLSIKRKFTIGAILLAPILILMYGGSVLEQWLVYRWSQFFLHSFSDSCPIWAGCVLCWVLDYCIAAVGTLEDRRHRLEDPL